MEPIKCQYCQALLNANDETLDQDLSCPTCGSRIQLRAASVSGSQWSTSMVDRFQLLEAVGRGQFGTVWRARDTQLDRIVAVKIPRQEDLDQHTRNLFRREATAAAALNHSNIVRVHEVAECDGLIYIVSEFIDGDDLKLCLAGNGFSEYQDAVRFIATTAEALHHAHQRGIIHRDLKPGNILVDADRQPHLTDFGLAKIESHESTLTIYGDQPVGTLSYMSPEQAAGNTHNLDCRSDVFSLGVVLYEMLTRQRPFAGVGMEILDKVRFAEQVSPRRIRSELPRDVETICLRALAKDPARRYPNALEFANDLRCCLDGKPIIAKPVTRLERSIRWLRNNLAIAAVCTIALFSTGAAAMTLFQSPSVHMPVHLATVPSNARVALFPLDPTTAEPLMNQVIHAGRSPVAVSVPPGDYLVVARLNDGRFHEVYRRVPEDPHRVSDAYPHRKWWLNDRGKLHLPSVVIPKLDVDKEMAEFSGGSVTAPFKLATHEVTVDQFQQTFRENPMGLDVPAAPGQTPVTGVLFDYAVWCAELMGKRLPTDAEYKFATTNGGSTRFPWGNDERAVPSTLSTVGSIDFDRTSTTPAVYGLISNGAELTGSPFLFQLGKNLTDPGQRMDAVLQSPVETQRLRLPSRPLFDVVSAWGSSTGVQHPSSELRFCVARSEANQRVGFRLARSAAPRWAP